MASTVTLYPIPGTYQGRPLIAYIGASMSEIGHWSEIKAWASYFFAADEDEIETYEVYWGGADGDENSAEVLEVSGAIVGAFDRPLTADEWSAVFLAAQGGSLSSQVSEAARARASAIAN